MATKKKAKRKKRRSPAQLRNDKRLGQMARKRAAARRKTNPKHKKKKVAKKRAKRKTNPKRTRSAKSHLFTVFRNNGNSTKFLGLMESNGRVVSTWKGNKGDALLFKSKPLATRIANNLAKKRGMSKYAIGVANSATSPASIAAQVRASK